MSVHVSTSIMPGSTTIGGQVTDSVKLMFIQEGEALVRTNLYYNQH
jgi:hypothetical protein